MEALDQNKSIDAIEIGTQRRRDPEIIALAALSGPDFKNYSDYRSPPSHSVYCIELRFRPSQPNAIVQIGFRVTFLVHIPLMKIIDEKTVFRDNKR
jgi:hypothetical protein